MTFLSIIFEQGSLLALKFSFLIRPQIFAMSHKYCDSQNCFSKSPAIQLLAENFNQLETCV